MTTARSNYNRRSGGLFFRRQVHRQGGVVNTRNTELAISGGLDSFRNTSLAFRARSSIGPEANYLLICPYCQSRQNPECAEPFLQHRKMLSLYHPDEGRLHYKSVE